MEYAQAFSNHHHFEETNYGSYLLSAAQLLDPYLIWACDFISVGFSLFYFLHLIELADVFS